MAKLDTGEGAAASPVAEAVAGAGGRSTATVQLVEPADHAPASVRMAVADDPLLRRRDGAAAHASGHVPGADA